MSEMYIDIKIEKIIAKVRVPTGRTDNILAFAELHFYETKKTEPTIKVKGFVIKNLKLPNSDNPIRSVSFPAFRSPKSKTGFQTSFIFENKALLDNSRKLILDAYTEETGDAAFEPEPIVDINDIPDNLGE